MRQELKELHQKNTAELKTLLAQKRKELLKIRLDLELKRTKDVHQRKSVRKEIARILTVIRERQLKGETKEDSP